MGILERSPGLYLRLTMEKITYILWWETLKMRKSYTIELKVDFDDESRHEQIKHAMLKAARNVLTKATLLADNQRQPQVAVHSEDFFEGTEEIKLIEDTSAE